MIVIINCVCSFSSRKVVLTLSVQNDGETMTIAQQIHHLLTEDPDLHPSRIAITLGVSEWDVVRHLPAELVTLLPGEQAESLLGQLADWGTVTTIVESCGSIFEVKAPFPPGKCARGYYNLMGRDNELHGHLKLDAVAHIALVSKRFMGKEGHSFQFFDAAGRCIFKIYLGRDHQRNLLPEQVARFMALRKGVSNE